MAEKTIQDLREHCNNLKQQREEIVKDILEKWLDKKFGYGKKPWRQIIGRRKTIRPVPLHPYECDMTWPNISDDLIIKIIEGLGFVKYTSLNGIGINLAIPECKKGEELTWAQMKIRKLNNDYSVYVAEQKELAKQYFAQILSELCEYSPNLTRTCDAYTIFQNYKFKETVSPQCAKFIRRYFAKNRIQARRFSNEDSEIIVFNV